MKLINPFYSFSKFITSIIILLVPSFFLLTSKPGYLFLIILLISLFGLPFSLRYLRVNKSNILFLFSTLFYFLVILFGFFWFGDVEFRNLDTPSRFLLTIPILLFISITGVKEKSLTYGIMTAGLILPILYLSGYEFIDAHHLKSGMIALISVIFSITAFFLLNDKLTKVEKVLLFIASICLSFFSFYLASRATWIAFILTFLILTYINPNNFSLKTRMISLAGFLLLFILMILSSSSSIKKLDRVISYNPDVLENRNIPKINNDQSITARILLWQEALKISKNNFLLGVGENNFSNYYEDFTFYTDNFDMEKEHKMVSKKFSHPHNEFLSSLVEQGLIGLISLLTLFTVPLLYFLAQIKRVSNENKEYAIFGLALILCYFFYGLTNGVFDHQMTTIFFAGMIAVSYGSQKYELTKRKT